MSLEAEPRQAAGKDPYDLYGALRKLKLLLSLTHE